MDVELLAEEAEFRVLLTKTTSYLIVTTSCSLFSSHVVPLVEANSQMLHIYTYTYLVLD
jgi:hypothetical protein